MIIGSGDIASVLPNREDLLFFASGVSNSQEIRGEEFRREVDLLLKSQDDFKRIVYFSSLSVFYSDTRYAQHKRRMEKTVKNFPQYTIIRLGNITWGNNPHTLINYMKAHPQAEIKDEYRYVCDKDEFLHWINLIPNWNVEINIPGRRMKVAQIVKEYCE